MKMRPWTISPVRAAKVMICYKNIVFAYNIFYAAAKMALLCKMLHFGLQNPAYWLAKPSILQRKMHAFRL